jgi:release factor glutamine methyltransferase
MRPAQIVRRAADYLERHAVDAPIPTAERLLAHVLGTDRTGLYSRARDLDADETRAFGRALCRRCAGEPTQHLVGRAAFRRLTLIVRPGVFVPRPETEIVVEAALDAVRDRRDPVVVDVGTGTGAIALSMKLERPDSTVVAVDRSAEAVALARDNARSAGLEVDVRLGDLLADIDPVATGPLDLVVSNPPYVDADRYEALPADVRADPWDSLVGGPPVYAALFEQSSARLGPGGITVVEIGEDRGDDVRGLALDAGARDVDVRPDLNGRDRVVVATWP